MYNPTKKGNLPAIPQTHIETEQTTGVIDETLYSSKLSNTEAQRIMAVIQEIQKKIYILGLLTESNDKKLSDLLTPDAQMYVKEMRMLDIKSQQKIENGVDLKTAEMKEISAALKHSARAIVRYFLQSQNVLLKLQYHKAFKSPIVAQFEHRLQEVKLLMFDRLKTTVEEETQMQEKVALILAKEQKTSAEVSTRKEELEKAKRERFQEVSKKNEVIRKLKDELKEIKRVAEDATRKLETRSKQKEDLDLSTSKEKQDQLIQEINQLKAQLESKTIANREEEANQRKKKFKHESEVENWIFKYDQDIEEKQNEIDDITVLYLEERGHYDELQGLYVELEKEYKQIKERQKELEQQRKAQESEMARLTAAAILIQKLFRGFKVRMLLKKKKNEKQKGGKKGKK